MRLGAPAARDRLVLVDDSVLAGIEIGSGNEEPLTLAGKGLVVVLVLASALDTDALLVSVNVLGLKSVESILDVLSLNGRNEPMTLIVAAEILFYLRPTGDLTLGANLQQEVAKLGLVINNGNRNSIR